MKNKTAIAITGGIGSGKSTISKLLELYEIPVYNSDLMAKKLMETDTNIKRQIIDAFGQESYKDNKLNRKYLAQKVFSSSDNTAKINKIVHTSVINNFKEWAKSQSAEIILFESAIIFENHLEKYFDKTIAVISPIKLRIQRVKARSRISRKDTIKRIKAQCSSQELREKADFIIINNEKKPIIPQIDKILRLI